MLGNYIHTHKGEPGDEYSSVKGYPVKLNEGLICKKVHTDHADHEKGGDGGRYAGKEGAKLASLFFYIFLDFVHFSPS